ncbi:uncharacterized protein LOC117582769 [Drosophila guanche]|uniref:uncharacterized protein LOC117582769 n=1 Tax=Drosophila guanche TaxID=7266 RepID=UPI001471063C|nr:uncharacterized protein LOC117582769 [Drosophila guanche]
MLAVVLCTISTASSAELKSDEAQISSANRLSSLAISKKMIHSRHMKCFLHWMARLVKNKATLTIALTRCTKGYGSKAWRIVTSFLSIVTIATVPIVSACTGIIVNAVVGGFICIKSLTTKGLPLIQALKKFHDVCSGEPRKATSCARKLFKDFFTFSSVYTVIDSCLYPTKFIESCEIKELNVA